VIAALKKANHPATKKHVSAFRSNLVACIAASFEPIYRLMTTRPSMPRFRRRVRREVADRRLPGLRFSSPSFTDLSCWHGYEADLDHWTLV
jgi:hypothetical protein